MATNTIETDMEITESTTTMVMDEVRDENDKVAQYIGQCKWFNNSYGYGFLTICDGPEEGTDIFVHWEGIKPKNSLYKTLKKGEYVIFDIVDSEKGKQAVNVRGICGGPLLCDHIQVKKTAMMPQIPPPPPPRNLSNHGDNWVPVARKNRVQLGIKRHRYDRPVVPQNTPVAMNEDNVQA
jgi:cold shock protein